MRWQALSVLPFAIAAACAPHQLSHRETVRMPVAVDGATILLEGVVYRPAAAGKHPVVVFSHGSSGGNPKASEPAEAQADYFVRHGFIVIVPMRRGRGQSEGVSLESEEKNCDPGSWAPGLKAAYDDLTGAIDFAAKLPDADASRIVLAGVSRGGFLSVAYAAEGARRSSVVGVINFSGGWMAQAEDNCPADFNELSFRAYGATSAAPQLWLYGKGDPYYAQASVRSYAQAFEESGGKLRFGLVANVPENGHMLAAHPDLWRAETDAYLAGLIPSPKS